MTVSFDTPVLVLAFNRPDITQQLFNQIRAIKPKFLFVAADGPRPENKGDLYNCIKTREIFNQVDWPCELKTFFREVNLGCGPAISSSINWFFEQVEQGIILEDDCCPDLSFFRFCEELLIRYKDDENIYLISGTNLQNGAKQGNESYYFSNYPTIWGWASWRRAWAHYRYDIPNFKPIFKNGSLDHVFQSFREKLYWRNKIQILESTKVKHTWDYQWCYAIWKNKGICISPNVNLITNTGFMNQSTHIFLRDSIREPSNRTPIRFPLIHPEKLINKQADKLIFKNVYSHSITRFFRLLKENGIVTILKYSFRKVL